MAGSPDLFVVCKNCGSEVSPYITECPYCGQRLRKRAPKIERDDAGESRPKPPRVQRPKLGPLKTGEIPGIRADETRRPYVTIALVLLGVFGYLVLAFVDEVEIALVGAIGDEWWRVASTPFVYPNVWYQLAVLVAVGLYGYLLEKRHGPLLVLLLFALTAFGPAAAVAALQDAPVALGANGAALGFIAAWVLPVLLARRAGADPDDDDADLLGTWVLALLVAAMPIAVYGADTAVAAMGALAGILVGLVLSRAKPRV